MMMPSITTEQFIIILCAMLTGSWVMGFVCGRIWGHYEMLDNDSSVRGYELYHDLLGSLREYMITREISSVNTGKPSADETGESQP
jgi:hypothetical protein